MGVQASAEVCPWCTEEAPPTQTSAILASRSFLAGAECEVLREEVECGEGWAGEVGRGGSSGHCQVFGNYKQGSPMIGSAGSLEGGRQGWGQEDQRERGGPPKGW